LTACANEHPRAGPGQSSVDQKANEEKKFIGVQGQRISLKLIVILLANQV
jgi:hypothetical protein